MDRPTTAIKFLHAYSVRLYTAIEIQFEQTTKPSPVNFRFLTLTKAQFTKL